MKLLDQHNQPITDVSSLPTVEPSGGAELPPVLGTTASDEQTVGGSEEEADDPKLSRRDYLIARLRHMQERIFTYEQQTRGQGKVSLTLMSTAVSLGLAIDHAAELHADWKPVRTAAPSTELGVGSKVVIKSRFRATYQDDLSEAEMDGLTIDRVGEKRLRCRTPSGAIVLIPAGHVDLA
jgi:hypothetical protein